MLLDFIQLTARETQDMHVPGDDLPAGDDGEAFQSKRTALRADLIAEVSEAVNEYVALTIDTKPFARSLTSKMRRAPMPTCYLRTTDGAEFRVLGTQSDHVRLINRALTQSR
jgi:hypothetical protein